MKRIFVFLLAAVMLITACSCGNTDNDIAKEEGTTTQPTTTTTRLADSITVTFPPTPLEVNTIRFSGGNEEVQQTMLVDEIYYEVDAFGFLNLYISGEKTYDIQGNHSPSSCELPWHLYDAEGNLVDSGCAWIGPYLMGETFQHQLINSIFSTSVTAGTSYRLVISDSIHE